MAKELKLCAHSRSKSRHCRICQGQHCQTLTLLDKSVRESSKTSGFGFSVVPQRSDRSLVSSLVHNLHSFTKLSKSSNNSSNNGEENSDGRVNPVTVVRWLYDRLSLTKDPVSIIERILADHRCLHQWVGLITDSEAAKVQDGDLEVTTFIVQEAPGESS